MKFHAILKFDKPIPDDASDYYSLGFSEFSATAGGKRYRVGFEEGFWWCAGDLVYITGEHPYEGFKPIMANLGIYRDMEQMEAMLGQITEISEVDAYLVTDESPFEYVYPSAVEYLLLEAKDGTKAEFRNVCTKSRL